MHMVCVSVHSRHYASLKRQGSTAQPPTGLQSYMTLRVIVFWIAGIFVYVLNCTYVYIH